MGRGARPAGEATGGSVIDVAVDARLEHGSRVLVARGGDEAVARVGWLGGDFHQLRLDPPLALARGDRLEVRRRAGGDLLGVAVVLDPDAPRHGPSNDLLIRLRRLADGAPARDVAAPPLDAAALALERRYREAGADPPADGQLDEDERAALFALREAGRVVRLERGRHVHVDWAPAGA